MISWQTQILKCFKKSWLLASDFLAQKFDDVLPKKLKKKLKETLLPL